MPGGRKKVFAGVHPLNEGVEEKAKRHGYDLINIITHEVLASNRRTGPAHNRGRVMSIHRPFVQRHRKPAAA